MVEDGGISFASSNLVYYADYTVITLNIREPQGLIDSIIEAYTPDTMISAPTLEREIEGHQFAFWSLNGVRQATPSGTALNQVKFNLSSNSELIAHFISSKQDEDEDGLADWYEMNQLAI